MLSKQNKQYFFGGLGLLSSTTALAHPSMSGGIHHAMEHLWLALPIVGGIALMALLFSPKARKALSRVKK